MAPTAKKSSKSSPKAAPKAVAAKPGKKPANVKAVSTKKLVAKKLVAKKPAAKKLAVKKAVKNVPAKKASVATVTKKAVATKISAKKAVPAKPTVVRSPKIVKPTLAKSSTSKKSPAKPFPAKLQSTTKGDSTTITVTPHEVNAGPEIVVEERRLVMTPPPRPIKSGKRAHSLKPIKGAPAPLIVNENENPWTVAELKAMRAELTKDLGRLKLELTDAEGEMEDLISAAGVGAGDDQADAGSKTFEREHEMSLVYNARDMVLQTERAIDRIDNKTYGRCEECGNAIGKARLQVFPRATLCMACKQKEERR
jgi:RNA polymerase-binding transcription factor DksA